MQIPDEEVTKRLRRENPWWERQESPWTPFEGLRPRPYLDQLRRIAVDSGVKRAAIVLGPRRVGKTVLVHHLIEALLDDGQDPTRVCFVGIDHPIYTHRSLDNLLELYARAVGLDSLEGAVVAFDEIQYLKEWERHLKKLVEDHPATRFIASGSAAAALKRMSQESGAGRLTLFELPPLSFFEYLTLTDRLHLMEGGDDGVWVSTDLEATNDEFATYLNAGGYPESALSPEIREDPGRYIKSDIIDKVLLRDLPSLYGIANTQELNSLFSTLAFRTAQEASLEKLTQQSGSSKTTLQKYIDYLTAAFLIHRVTRVRPNARPYTRERVFKLFLTNPSLRAALFSPLNPGDEDFGHLVETGVACQWLHGQIDRIRYVRHKDHEIDFVEIDPGTGQAVRAIEVKWSDRVADDLGAVDRQIDLCQSLGLDTLTVTTATARGTYHARVGTRVILVPAAEFCFAEGARPFAAR